MTLGYLRTAECQAGGGDIFNIGFEMMSLQLIYWKANIPVPFLSPGQHGDRYLGV